MIECYVAFAVIFKDYTIYDNFSVWLYVWFDSVMMKITGIGLIHFETQEIYLIGDNIMIE